MIRHRWEHHQVSGLRGFGGFDCSCSPASFPGNHLYHAHRRRAFFVEAKVAVAKNKGDSPNGIKGRCKSFPSNGLHFSCGRQFDDHIDI